MTDKAAEAAHTEKGKEENPPPPYEHTELPETKKAVKHADDERELPKKLTDRSV